MDIAVMAISGKYFTAADFGTGEGCLAKKSHGYLSYLNEFFEK
jgi:hypothetical protein